MYNIEHVYLINYQLIITKDQTKKQKNPGSVVLGLTIFGDKVLYYYN